MGSPPRAGFEPLGSCARRLALNTAIGEAFRDGIATVGSPFRFIVAAKLPPT